MLFNHEIRSTASKCRGCLRFHVVQIFKYIQHDKLHCARFPQLPFVQCTLVNECLAEFPVTVQVNQPTSRPEQSAYVYNTKCNVFLDTLI